MRALLIALCGSLLLSACGQHAANSYPESAHARFEQSCPRDSAVCTCTWDRITRSMTYDEYSAAIADFRRSGHMDPRITRARTYCLEHHPS